MESIANRLSHRAELRVGGIFPKPAGLAGIDALTVADFLRNFGQAAAGSRNSVIHKLYCIETENSGLLSLRCPNAFNLFHPLCQQLFAALAGRVVIASSGKRRG